MSVTVDSETGLIVRVFERDDQKYVMPGLVDAHAHVFLHSYDEAGALQQKSPRLFVATKVLASTGSFEPRSENTSGGHCLPAGADAVDGVKACLMAVWIRIAAGADIIKFFADYRRRITRCPPAQQHPYIPSVRYPPKEPNADYLISSQQEMNMIVKEATLARAPVSAHCCTLEGALGAIEAGASTLEDVCDLLA
ncbi:hypothetical protein B0J15DRAFT_599708 [Fusarium solani]|uniref:Amidohydrolase-related domain-containing protein n=1 Tax=Fusarium solani TaxID=169388 RepID=A0A9P9G3U2_FUSSL|nr:uncharacterized protein B0J15DRAFT_599708 [Fusarium solani]KAH7230722.1 hypothetical protein B0J15DRAFT_599708 [Fusarium solani]